MSPTLCAFAQLFQLLRGDFPFDSDSMFFHAHRPLSSPLLYRGLSASPGSICQRLDQLFSLSVLSSFRLFLAALPSIMHQQRPEQPPVFPQRVPLPLAVGLSTHIPLPRFFFFETRLWKALVIGQESSVLRLHQIPGNNLTTARKCAMLARARERPIHPAAHGRPVCRPHADRKILEGFAASAHSGEIHSYGQHATGGSEVNLGPLGGNLDDPHQSPEARRAPLNALVDPFTGFPQLHRKDGFEDTARPGRKNEQAWHRMAAFMLLAGRTNSEIAAAAGVVPETVSSLRANRWFQELLATLANVDGEEVVGVIRAEALASVEKLVSLRDDPEVTARVQLAAATTLLEHAAGKPTQRVLSVSASTTFGSESDELAAIRSELQALRNQNPQALQT